MVNDYFRSIFVDIDFESDNIDVDAILKLMNTAIYNYFGDNHGTARNHVNNELVLKYKEYSVHSLKKASKRLEFVAAPVTKIRNISCLSRSKLT